MVVLVLLLLGLAGLPLLVGCGDSAAGATCTRTRGGLDSRTSYWSCASAEDAAALRERYGFEECRLIQGMNADSDEKDQAYECRRAA